MRALVLGGGGPIGVAWESGLLSALAEAGADVSDADLIVGTSAGSVVGSQLALGRTPRELYERQLAPEDPGRREQRNVDLSGVLAQFIKLYTSDRPAQELRAELGAFALQADTMSEDEWLAGFLPIEIGTGDTWPTRRFACTAIDTADGAFVVWDNDSNVPLSLAVASSCAVPGVFPPVTINGRRYMDGGMRSTTNADLARNYEKVLVIPVTTAARPAAAAAVRPDLTEARRKRFEAEIEGLRALGSAVEVIGPREEFSLAFGMNLMDFRRRREAAECGLRQGTVEAARVRDFWK